MDFIKQIMSNRTIYRILFNNQVKKWCGVISGSIVDLAGGGDASYYSYLPQKIGIVKTNINLGANRRNDLIVDLNKDFPFEDRSFDVALLFNALYIVDNRIKTFREIKRILKDNGVLYFSSPFIANEMPEPHDYCRLTYEGLEKELKEAGFFDVKIERFGERFSSAVYLLSPFWWGWGIKIFVYNIALFLDKMVPQKIRKEHPVPLGYFGIVKK